MIWFWAFELMASLVAGGIGLLPVFTPPEWVTDAESTVNDMLAYATGLGAWVPMGLAVTVAAAVLFSALVGFGIKALRIALSFGTLGGGSAG